MQTELTGAPQTTAQHGLLSAFQLLGHVRPHSGSDPEDTFFRNAPVQAIEGLELAPNIPESFIEVDVCPAISHPSLCVPVGGGGKCISLCEERRVRLCLSPAPSPGLSQTVMAVLMPVRTAWDHKALASIFKANVSCHMSL